MTLMTKDKPKIVSAAMPFRQSLFWDVDPKNINPEKHARYIIERVLDLGNDTEVKWLFQYYQKKLIKDVVKNSRVIHKKSKSLWTLVVR